ncbi:MAG: hypothetical protein P8L83_06670 [Flavobacteriaceae bacterium]|nr:hypothetical protein [Flavobacteriaceae bacterium]
MKFFKLYPFVLGFLILFSCKEENSPSLCGEAYPYKAKLAIKGICFNYVIEFIDVSSNFNLVESQWVDETTGRVYNNVFRLSNYCDFPPEIQEGDEFYFALSTSTDDPLCFVCEAFRPTPAKSINIDVCELALPTHTTD